MNYNQMGADQTGYNQMACNLKEEWTTAYEDMSCYYANEGYGTGWDPWLSGCYFFKK